MIVLAPLSPRVKAKMRAASRHDSFQLEMMGRYTVGAKNLSGGAGISSVLSQLDGLARTTMDKLRICAAAGAVLDADAAIRRLQEIDPGPAERDVYDALWVLYGAGSDQLTEKQRSLLTDELGWFGKLALSKGLPDSDPVVVEINSQSRRTFVGMFGYVLLLGGIILVGVCLWVVAIILLASGSVKLQPTIRHIPGVPFVEAFAIYLSGFIGLSMLMSKLKLEGLGWSFTLTIMLPVALLWCRLRGVVWRDVMDAIGWHRGRGVFREIGSGFLGYLLGMPIVAIGFLVSYQLMKFSDTPPDHPITGEIGKESFLMLLILACVWAPIFEETMFRGMLFHSMRIRVPWLISAIVVGTIFAAIHPQGWTFIPTLGAIGFVLALIRQWRGPIIAPMVCHAMVNALTLSLLWVMLG